MTLDSITVRSTPTKKNFRELALTTLLVARLFKLSLDKRAHCPRVNRRCTCTYMMSHSGPAATFDAVTKVVARGSPSYTSRCARLLELTPARHGEAARIEIFYGATLIGNPVQRGLHIARSQLLSMAHADLICPSRGRWARPHSSHSAGLPPQPFLSPGAATQKSAPPPKAARLAGARS